MADRRDRLALLVLFLASLLGAHVARASDLHVDAVNGDDQAGDGTAAAPWKSITRALDALTLSGSADVWIAPGVYDAANGERFPIGANADFIFGSVALHGSATGGTVIRAENASALRCSCWERMCPCSYENLTIECAAGPCPTGIYTRLLDSTFRHNRVQGFATGIEAEYVVLGLSLPGDYIHVDLDGNDVVENGVGFHLHASLTSLLDVSPTAFGDLTNNVFAGNGTGVRVETTCSVAEGWAGAVPRLWNNTFVGQVGSAIELVATSGAVPCARSIPEIGNNVIAGSGGYGIDDGTGPETDPSWIVSNDFFENSSGDVRRSVNEERSIYVDPALVDAPAGNYRLAPGSGCIDAGALSFATPGMDHDGFARPLDGDFDRIAIHDVGAFEAPGEGLAATDLRRADFTALDPATPARALAFPFSSANPLTPVVRPAFGSTYIDALVLGDLGRPLAFYQDDPDIGREIVLAKTRRLPAGPLEIQLLLRLPTAR